MTFPIVPCCCHHRCPLCCERQLAFLQDLHVHLSRALHQLPGGNPEKRVTHMDLVKVAVET